jgi:type I restriction enzyme M protein
LHYVDIPGFCRVADFPAIRSTNYALTPGRFVGTESGDENVELFETTFARLLAELDRQMEAGAALDQQIRAAIAGLRR